MTTSYPDLVITGVLLVLAGIACCTTAWRLGHPATDGRCPGCRRDLDDCRCTG